MEKYRCPTQGKPAFGWQWQSACMISNDRNYELRYLFL